MVYDPERPGAKHRSGPWWLVVNIDENISTYYRWWANKNGLPIVKMSWPAHITVLDGTVVPSNIMCWKKYEGQIIEYEYNNDIRSVGPYYYVKVTCPFLFDVREELGLKPYWPLHITIGRIKKEDLTNTKTNI